jgi:hypothetical protein
MIYSTRLRFAVGVGLHLHISDNFLFYADILLCYKQLLFLAKLEEAYLFCAMFLFKLRVFLLVLLFKQEIWYV